MINFHSFNGVVTSIDSAPVWNNEDTGCKQIMSVTDQNNNVVNFVVSPVTYFANQEVIRVGDMITGYYNANAPAILIYPPQFPALVVVKQNSDHFVKVDYFNQMLVSSDGQLKLNIAQSTRIVLRNGQPFAGDIADRNLIVFYKTATRSIPAQTTPSKIVVWC